MIIAFTVYGESVAQGRPRATLQGGHIRMYDPKKSSDFKHYLRLAAAEYAPERLLNEALSVTVQVYKPTPKSFSKKKAQLAEEGKIRPITKPDADNYVKGVKDALKNVIWKDDSLAVDMIVRKWYSERPRVEILVETLE
jgi:Holliday junction resolvase RusA-like endonuclease